MKNGGNEFMTYYYTLCIATKKDRSRDMEIGRPNSNLLGYTREIPASFSFWLQFVCFFLQMAVVALWILLV